MNPELTYSAWHRSLGYSYFAMDLDFIEIRENQPAAIIESSLTTPTRPTFDAVINRFLEETGGFQFEMAYWVSLWLNVPAFLVCMNPLVRGETSYKLKGGIQILNLHTGESVTTNYARYTQFIADLPAATTLFKDDILELPELLEKLKKKYSGITRYPFFNPKRREKWNKDYIIRLNEIKNRITRQSPVEYQITNNPVKGETTGTRPVDYEIIREKIKMPYLNLNWVEWRKEYSYQTIGRPAALVKTVLINEDSKNFLEEAKNQYKLFSLSEEYNWWNVIAEKMLVSWHFTAYSVTVNGDIGNRFLVWTNGKGQPQDLNRVEYEKFIKLL